MAAEINLLNSRTLLRHVACRSRFATKSRLVVAASCMIACGALFGATTVFDYVPLSIDGSPAPLAFFRGQVVLIVNVASHSRFTPQFAGLESIYEKYKSQGFSVLAFPANDFGQEEPGSNVEIKAFATEKYKVTFPMFSKVAVSGVGIAPLYQLLVSKEAGSCCGGPVPWNFTKFLVGRDGKVIARFAPDVEPDAPEIIDAIEKTLRDTTDGTTKATNLAAHVRSPRTN
jgi:glutathione peroxidase